MTNGEAKIFHFALSSMPQTPGETKIGCPDCNGDSTLACIEVEKWVCDKCGTEYLLDHLLKVLKERSS